MQTYTEVFIKGAAVSGILMLWAGFTIEAFKFSWHIISTSQEKYKPSFKAVCESCQDINDDNEHGTHFCEACS